MSCIVFPHVTPIMNTCYFDSCFHNRSMVTVSSCSDDDDFMTVIITVLNFINIMDNNYYSA